MRLSAGRSATNLYERARVLFSAVHLSVLDMLERALDDRYRVCSNVRLTDVINVSAGLSRKQRLSALKRLPSSRLDFIICEKQDSFILGAVLIDEASNESGEVHVQQEAALDRFLESMGIPVCRLSSQRDYTMEDIRIQMSRTLFLKWKYDPSEEGVIGGGGSAEKKESPYGDCPACGRPFVKRRARKGTYAGKYFLTCSNYPVCKYVRLIKDPSTVMKAPK